MFEKSKEVYYNYGLAKRNNLYKFYIIKIQYLYIFVCFLYKYNFYLKILKK